MHGNEPPRHWQRSPEPFSFDREEAHLRCAPAVAAKEFLPVFRLKAQRRVLQMGALDAGANHAVQKTSAMVSDPRSESPVRPKVVRERRDFVLGEIREDALRQDHDILFILAEPREQSTPGDGIAEVRRDTLESALGALIA